MKLPPKPANPTTWPGKGEAIRVAAYLWLPYKGRKCCRIKSLLNRAVPSIMRAVSKCSDGAID
jgi:hypothetical protein